MESLSKYKVSPTLLVGLLGTALLAFYLSSGDEAPKKAPKALSNRLAAHTKPNPDANVGAIPPPKEAPLNAFRPLIVKSETPVTRQAPPPKEGASIAADAAGGEGNWIYRSFARIDKIPVAMLENSSTEQVAMLRPGDKWKTGKVLEVTELTIKILSDKGGLSITSRFDAEKEAQKAAESLKAGPAPMQMSPGMPTPYQGQVISRSEAPMVGTLFGK